MTLDASGNLLLGTTTHANYSGGTTEFTIGVTGTGTTTGGAITFVNGSGLISYLGGQQSETALGTFTSTPLIFLTNNTERARFASGGSFGIGTTSISNLLQVAGAIGLNYSAMASGTTSGDFTVSVSGLETLTSSNWRVAGVFVFYTGINADQSGGDILVTALYLRGLSTWGLQGTNNIVGTATVTGANATSTSLDLTFNVNDSNFGSVYALVLGGYDGSRPSISITA